MSTRWWEARLDQIQYGCYGAGTVYAKNLAASLGALLQDALEHLLLKVERAVISRAGIESDFTDVSRLREVILPKGNFAMTLGDKLGVKAEARANMAREARNFEVAGPGFRRGSNCERVDASLFGLRNCRLKIRVQIEMAMEIYERRFHELSDRCRADAREQLVDLSETPSVNVRKSSLPGR